MANHGAFSNPGIQGRGAEQGFRRCFVDGLNKVLFRLRRRLLGRLSGVCLAMSMAFLFFPRKHESQQTVIINWLNYYTVLFNTRYPPEQRLITMFKSLLPCEQKPFDLPLLAAGRVKHYRIRGFLCNCILSAISAYRFLTSEVICLFRWLQKKRCNWATQGGELFWVLPVVN